MKKKCYSITIETNKYRKGGRRLRKIMDHIDPKTLLIVFSHKQKRCCQLKVD